MPRDYRAVSHRPDHYETEPEAAPDAPDCPGRCNAAYRAAEARRENTGTEHDLDPWPGEPVWCRSCANTIRAALEDWPALAAALAEEIDSGVTAALAEFVSGSKNRPIHDHETESFLLDEFAEWIGSWEDSIRAARELDPRASTDLHRRPVRVIADACAFLLPHLTWHLSERPDDEAWIAVEFGEDLLAYHRRAQTLTGAREPEPVRCHGVPCPNCLRTTLAWEVEDSPSRQKLSHQYVYGGDGEPAAIHRPLGPGSASKATATVPVAALGSITGYVYCRRCRPVFRLSPEEYQRWTRMCAADPRVRIAVTPELLAEVFGGSVPRQYAKPSA